MFKNTSHCETLFKIVKDYETKIISRKIYDYYIHPELYSHAQMPNCFVIYIKWPQQDMHKKAKEYLFLGEIEFTLNNCYNNHNKLG